MYTITLANGTKLENLELNGNNYIAEGVIEDSVFQDNLSSVTITDGETTETYTDMVLISNRVDGGRSWFILGEKSPQEKAMERINTLLESNANSITDVQVALAEVYELVLMGVCKMAKIYAELIRKGIKTLEDVPAQLRDEVKKLLEV